MISTTHVDLKDTGARQRDRHPNYSRDIDCYGGMRINGASKLPFWQVGNYCVSLPNVSDVPYDTVMANLRSDLHNVALLGYTGRVYELGHGIELLLHSEHEKGRNQLASLLAVGIARAGSRSPTVKADVLARLKEYDLGLPCTSLSYPRHFTSWKSRRFNVCWCSKCPRLWIK